jgi:hypothetical protein
VTAASNERIEYLDRLSDLLPPREVARVRSDVEALIEEHAYGLLEAHPDLAPHEAERRALKALGPPEQLAEALASDPLTIPLATRQLFLRVLTGVFAGHLLLSIVLTAVGSESAAIPGLLGPLPKTPAAAVFLSVVTLFLLDTGLVLVLFVALGTGRSHRALRGFSARDHWTRKGAVEGLVLLVLLALILNAFLDTIFSVKHGAGREPFLSADLKRLVPLVNVMLCLFAVRHVLTLTGRARGALAACVESAACLLGTAALILATTRSKLVHIPAGNLGQIAADVLDDLIERALLLVFVVGALMLIVRFVRHALRAWHLLRV